MMRAAILQHAPFEGPGRVLDVLEEHGLEPSIYHLYRGDAAPDDLSPDDLLVVMGGPMGVLDVGGAEYPFLAAEVELLRQRVALGAPVLGVCLGAQLLAHAAGARVYPNLGVSATPGEPAPRVYEVGWGPIYFHDAGSDPILKGLMGTESMLHWHGDTFDLPADARLLASTDACRNQAFELQGKLFGLQFHCELEPRDIEAFVQSDPAYVLRALGPLGAERIAAETLRYLPRYREVGRRLLQNIVRAMLATA